MTGKGHLRVGTWNLQWASGDRAVRAGQLLASLGCADLMLFQEAHPEGIETFCNSAGLDWCRSAHAQFATVIEGHGRSRGRGAALAGRGEPPSQVQVLEDLPLVEKALVGRVQLAGLPVTVASYHAPAGVTHFEKKPLQAVRFARWIAQVDGPKIFGGDFNTPDIDHPVRERLRTHWHTDMPKLMGEPGDDLLVGAEPVHGMRDAYRSWLDAHPSAFQEIVAARPDGPLAITHRSGRRRHTLGTPRRYDAIWVSEHFAVDAMNHYYDEAIGEEFGKGIDHALVVADLSPSAMGTGN